MLGFGTTATVKVEEDPIRRVSILASLTQGSKESSRNFNESKLLSVRSQRRQRQDFATVQQLSLQYNT